MNPPMEYDSGAPDAAADRFSMAEAASPLDESHYLLLRRAMLARRPVLRAVRTARFSAMTILAIGILSLPLAMLSPGWQGVFVAAGLCIVGGVEYAGSQRLQRGEPAAASRLGTNQLALMGLIIAYCAMQMWAVSPGKGAGAAGSRSGARTGAPANSILDVDEVLNVWVPLATYGFYVLVMALTVVFQGGLALYYFTRRPYLEAARRDTPAWIRRLLDEVGA